jgi:hypothetical protein
MRSLSQENLELLGAAAAIPHEGVAVESTNLDSGATLSRLAHDRPVREEHEVQSGVIAARI